MADQKKDNVELICKLALALGVKLGADLKQPDILFVDRAGIAGHLCISEEGGLEVSLSGLGDNGIVDINSRLGGLRLHEYGNGFLIEYTTDQDVYCYILDADGTIQKRDKSPYAKSD